MRLLNRLKNGLGGKMTNNNVSPIKQDEDISVSCGDCHRKIFDGQVIRARAVNVIDGTALCRCKKWVKVPITLMI